ncbi:MAG: hypothetical protein DRP85_02225 [Candidatus Makaraimicrobium thalassicum]|nr:MAG: hypothetical protein DRP85_02225 [Candidatus Omnitrophota bacterium]
MKQKLPERRRFVRIDTPLRVIVKTGDWADEAIARNISPVGLRFEIGRELKGLEKVVLSLYLPTIDDPIRLVGKVVWQSKVNLEDKAPYDIGMEILDIDDRTKNVFLKYLCDLLYRSTYRARV